MKTGQDSAVLSNPDLNAGIIDFVLSCFKRRVSVHKPALSADQKKLLFGCNLNLP